MDEVAERIGIRLGRDFSYEEETVDEAYASRRAGYPEAAEFELDAWVSTYTAIANGAMARVTSDIKRITGKRARTLEQAIMA